MLLRRRMTCAARRMIQTRRTVSGYSVPPLRRKPTTLRMSWARQLMIKNILLLTRYTLWSRVSSKFYQKPRNPNSSINIRSSSPGTYQRRKSTMRWRKRCPLAAHGRILMRRTSRSFASAQSWIIRIQMRRVRFARQDRRKPPILWDVRRGIQTCALLASPFKREPMTVRATCQLI